jgi:hypothetical protein
MDWDEFLRGPDGTAVPPHKSDRAQKPGAKVKLRQAIIAMARTGVVFLSRSEIARMNPEIYANPLELGQNSRWIGKEAEQQIRSYLDAAPFSGSFQKAVEYQRDKSVGRTWSKRPGRHEAGWGWLGSTLVPSFLMCPPLRNFHFPACRAATLKP